MQSMNPTSSTSGPQPNPDHLQVALSENVGYIKVFNRGSFKVSSALKQFADRVLDRGGQTLWLDLHDCIGMDSTFMGVLAGISQRFKKENGGQVVLVGVSNKLVGLMTTLGLSRLVTVVEEAEAGTVPSKLEKLAQSPESPLESAETMLEAHQNLVDLQADNALRFQDVLDYLREDIQRHRS